MSLKRFNADVRSARTRLEETGIQGIVSIDRGDSDGEVVATFAHDHLAKLLPIRMLAQSADAYPDDNNFMLFTDVDDIPFAIAKALEDLQNYTFGQTVFESIRDLSTALNQAMSQTNGDGDASMDSLEDDAEADDEADFYDYGDDEHDDAFGLSAGHPSLDNRSPTYMASGVSKKLKRDLRRARNAGAKVGIISGRTAQLNVVSLSIRANKLGIPDEVLEAWDVEPSDYIVLLIRMEGPYPSAEKLSTDPVEFFTLKFRFGKCCRYKPTTVSAEGAFNAIPRRPTGADTSKPAQLDDGAFKKLFISNSLEQFMNENFLSLFKLRLTGCPTWDDANARLMDLSVRFQNSAIASPNESKGKGKVVPAPVLATEGPRTLPALLILDSFTEPVEMMSTPLVAMQFATHYFVRCTEYCLRCHRKLDKEFEAMKPFVCPNPLCLFQYITMGFGPSVEHEILTQPYVVDLLITLCYSAVQTTNTVAPAPGVQGTPAAMGNLRFPIRDFPTGLRLKVPRPPRSSEDAESLGPFIPVLVDLDRETITVKNTKDLDGLSGDRWMMLQHTPHGPLAPTLMHEVYIKYVDRSTNSIQAQIRHKDPALHTIVLAGEVEMELHGYDAEFDDLDPAGKAKAMVYILNTLPPVSHMREHLVRRPHNTLKSCPEISPAALTLLTWIVASNRSCILQVSQVEDNHATDLSLLGTVKTREQEVIPSMGSNIIQFRFAQGTPDKELRFHRALKKMQAQGKTEYPTLFAWHGSSLKNWHSILRQGLDFVETLNGRAFGHGVYFSRSFNTSLGYMQPWDTWPGSALNTCGVMALCEIINSPEQFVSSNPHYVVNQLDWIQCRYLLVHRRASVNPSTTAGHATPTGDKKDNVLEIAQDPRCRLKGPNNVDVKIPSKALPGSRKAQKRSRQKKASTSSSTTKRSRDVLEGSVDTEEENASDLETLFSDDDAAQPSLKRGPLTTSRTSSVDTATLRQAIIQRPPTPPPMTDFRPGSLDLKSLPRLALPQWADTNSTRRLANDIKQLQKVHASTPIHELGWHIDFDNIENMFQWIVELHSFDPELPLAKDMKKANVKSVVLEVRFGRDYPFSPPFVRVIRPCFLPFSAGGGGHVTIGGALCMELLTSSGWTPATSMEAVFVSIRMAISSTDPRPARLRSTHAQDYTASEALDTFERAARTHGWTVPTDLHLNATQAYN